MGWLTFMWFSVKLNYRKNMKKIDLHVHTTPGNGDAQFDFDIEKFKEYVKKLSIDVIAITNHNLFNQKQFETIAKEIRNVVILPGVEINLEDGHLLLIGENKDLDDFNQKCNLIREEIDGSGKITVQKLKEIFVDLEKYILIPHYDKKPKIKQNTIEALKKYISAGEVQSPKKFNRIIKEPNSLVPVLFSDVRIGVDLDVEGYQGKQTFIKTNSNDITINIIKASLQDKTKIFLSNAGEHGFFQVLSDGQELSNGLNVVLGGRSSGKTFFLNRLEGIYNTDGKSVKYIKQFDLVKDDEDKFNQLMEKGKSAIREKYLQEFKLVVEDIINVDRKTTDFKLEKYTETLLEFAFNKKLHDEFSKAILFTEIPFKIHNDKSLEDIIGAVKILLGNSRYKDTINKYLSSVSLNSLLTDLENQYKGETEERLKKVWVNDLIKNINKKLKSKTAAPHIYYNNIDFYDVKIEEERVKKFDIIVNSLRTKRVINEDASFEKFIIQALVDKYNGAGELLSESGRKISFAGAFKKYNLPIDFLEELKNEEQLEKTELYKYFCKVTYQVLNKFGKKISGGERAEFNLLKALQDARQYEMLLIDEPESSFDNLFLKDNVNKEIKEISTELPVVVVTHNNTVGMLMQPDYILYTRRKIINDKDKYDIFSGSPGEKEFKTASGVEAIGSYTTLLDTLEAGEVAYGDRGKLYANFKK